MVEDLQRVCVMGFVLLVLITLKILFFFKRQSHREKGTFHLMVHCPNDLIDQGLGPVEARSFVRVSRMGARYLGHLLLLSRVH